MALGAYQAAVTRARITGRPVPIGNLGLVASPNGTVGTSGGGFGGQGAGSSLPTPPIPPATQPAAVQPVTPSAPSTNVAGVQGAPGSPSGSAVMAPANPALTGAFDEYGRPVPTVNVYPQPTAQTQVQAPLNQANPNTTYVSPNTAQPTGALPVVGQTDTQSGQPVHATYNMPPAPPSLATEAKNYRAKHGLANSDDAATDALNAESLAAARAGRTSFDPTLAAQYAQAPAAGVYGPRTDVVNALSMPAAATPQQNGNQLAQNLLAQGVY